jgi:hypothetical protein
MMHDFVIWFVLFDSNSDVPFETWIIEGNEKSILDLDQKGEKKMKKASFP